MNRKLIYSIIGILIVISVIYGILAYNSTYNAKVESASSVSIPEGFTFEQILNNETTIKNNITTLNIKEVKNSASLDTLAETYKTGISDKNYTIEESSRDYNNNVTVVSVIVRDGDELKESNFWYSKNGKIYQIQLEGKNNKTAVETLINSTTINPIPFI